MNIIAVDKLSGRQFEAFLEKLLLDLGFTNVRQTPISGDFGGDILAEKDGKTCVIQAKRNARTVGVRAVQEAHAARDYYGVTDSMVIANRTFSGRAKELAHRCGCTLVDRLLLTDWLSGRFTSSADLFRYISEEGITRYRISNDDLVLAYRALKEKLGKHVRVCDMDTQGKYSSSAYRKRWGSWNKFLSEVGDSPILRRDLTTDDLRAEYSRIRTSLGRVPTRSEFSSLSAHSPDRYERSWGSWNAFLESIGEAPIKRHLIPKEKLIGEFKRVRAMLGKSPTVKEMAQYGGIAPTTYRRLWGSWSQFLKEMGEVRQRRNIPEQELVNAYLKLKKQLRKQSLTQHDMNKYGEFSSSVFERRWGSWTKFLSFVGDTGSKRTGITDDDLKSDYLAVRKKLGKTSCSAGDIRQHGKFSLSIYLNRFGKWRRLQEIVDESP
ncbi:MAG: restriction endonuclease [Deltaproteobacteria bacterium]|nr:restriction endonuclease [Deltaproteobacteria bacterium]